MLFPEGTCASCQNITLHRLLTTHDGSPEVLWVDYSRNLRTNCPMCRMIFEFTNLENEITGDVRLGFRVDDLQPRIDIYTGREVHEVRITKYRGFDTAHGCDGWFRIYAELGSYASKFVPSSRAPPSNFSDTTFQRIARWIKDCDDTHTICRSHSTHISEVEARHLPTRVVHVGSATRSPRLHISLIHQNAPYVALSHCWGRVTQVRTLKANIEQFKEEIPFDSLSKTFQDAIHVARRLGIQYIWIDSLCIVQDDKSDWLQESERMGLIYSNAYITIAATWAIDGNGGLDSVRPSSNWVKFPFDGTDRDKGYMWFTDASWTSETDLDNAPLNARGWVCQEKTLSQRIIHFASSQVYWECKKRFVGEEREDKIYFTGVTLEPSLFWAVVNAISGTRSRADEHEEFLRNSTSWRQQLTQSNRSHTIPDLMQQQFDQFHERWRTFVSYYCTKKFTKKSDRLIALLGIIRVVEKQTGIRCVDGHWYDGSQQFLYELLWLPKDQRALSVLDDDRRSRLCSSWSWASLEGSIEYDSSIDRTEETWGTSNWWRHGLKDCELFLMSIEDKVHVPWPSHPLTVSGMLRTFYKCELKQGRDENWKTRRFEVKTEGSKITNGWVRFDREAEEPEMFQFSPCYMSGGSIICLTLVQRPRPEISARCFERVGVGCIQKIMQGNGSTYGNMRQFERCERGTYYII